jgi:hypothetical protein
MASTSCRSKARPIFNPRKEAEKTVVVAGAVADAIAGAGEGDAGHQGDGVLRGIGRPQVFRGGLEDAEAGAGDLIEATKLRPIHAAVAPAHGHEKPYAPLEQRAHKRESIHLVVHGRQVREDAIRRGPLRQCHEPRMDGRAAPRGLIAAQSAPPRQAIRPQFQLVHDPLPHADYRAGTESSAFFSPRRYSSRKSRMSARSGRRRSRKSQAPWPKPSAS